MTDLPPLEMWRNGDYYRRDPMLPWHKEHCGPVEAEGIYHRGEWVVWSEYARRRPLT